VTAQHSSERHHFRPETPLRRSALLETPLRRSALLRRVSRCAERAPVARVYPFPPPIAATMTVSALP
jgi:hypothetical protein